jgi:hypothetical protein
MLVGALDGFVKRQKYPLSLERGLALVQDKALNLKWFGG